MYSYAIVTGGGGRIVKNAPISPRCAGRERAPWRAWRVPDPEKEKFFGWVLFFLGFLVDPGIISSRQSGGDIGLGLGYHYCIFVYTIACALSSEPKLEVTQNRGSSNPPP